MKKEILYRFFRGETTPVEEQSLMDWLDADAANRRMFDRERELFTAVQLFAPAAKATARRPRSMWLRAAGYAARIAAVLILAVGIGRIYVDHREQAWAELTNTIRVPAGQRLHFTFHDGSSVWLNSGAQMEYPAVFAGKTRRVKVCGEALFDVEHNKAHPFVVQTQTCSIEVLGTNFNVNAGRDGSFSTTLLRGSVRVRSLADPQETALLEPDQKVELLDGHLVVRQNDDPNEYLWSEGLISLGGRTFEQLLHTFENCYGVRFTVKLDHLPQVTSMGKIRISDGIGHALSILRRGCAFNYTIDPVSNEITIY